jgi:hypothetical protein
MNRTLSTSVADDSEEVFFSGMVNKSIRPCFRNPSLLQGKVPLDGGKRRAIPERSGG